MAEVEIFSIDDVRPDAPRRGWIHGWKHDETSDGLRSLLLAGGEVRLAWPRLIVAERRP